MGEQSGRTKIPGLILLNLGLGPSHCPTLEMCQSKATLRTLGSRDIVLWGGEILGKLATRSFLLSSHNSSLENKPRLHCRKSACWASECGTIRKCYSLTSFCSSFQPRNLLAHPIQSRKQFYQARVCQALSSHFAGEGLMEVQRVFVREEGGRPGWIMWLAPFPVPSLCATEYFSTRVMSTTTTRVPAGIIYASSLSEWAKSLICDIPWSPPLSAAWVILRCIK